MSVVGDVKHHKKEFDMNKIVLRNLIIMLSLVFGLMVAGCKAEPEEEIVVEKTVESRYWGTFTRPENSDTFILSEKKIIFTNPYEEFPAWTEGTKLYYDGRGATWHFGTFVNSDKLLFDDGTGEIYYDRQ
jgi:hypothetical protein